MSFYGNSDFLLEVQKGNIEGHSIKTIISINGNFSQNTTQDIWVPGGTMILATAAETWEIVSTSADDSAAGTGARTVEVTYLDDLYAIDTETLTMNGTTPVPFVSTKTFRPEFMTVLSWGSTNENQGIITVRRVSDSEPRDAINTGANVSASSHRTIPLGLTGHILTIGGFCGRNTDGELRQLVTNGDSGAYGVQYGFAVTTGSFSANLGAPGGQIPEKSDIKMIGITTNNNSTLGSTVQVLLVDNTLENLA